MTGQEQRNPSNERSAATTALRCDACGVEWEQPLTNEPAAPRCPACGHVGDRELSLRYPAGVLAGEQALDGSSGQLGGKDDVRQVQGSRLDTSSPDSSATTPCGDERPHAPHNWHGVAKLEVGTKYGDDWRCPGVSAAQGREAHYDDRIRSILPGGLAGVFLREYRAELERRCRAHMDEADAYDDEGVHVGMAIRRRALAAGLNEAINTLDEMWREARRAE